MKKEKHDWNGLPNYLDIHESVLVDYQSFFSRPTSYRHNWITDSYLELTAEFILTTYKGNAVSISIHKDVEVRMLAPPRGKRKGRQMARVDSYTYVAYASARGCLIRYCSPHDRLFDKLADHHEFHHKHDFTSGTEKVTRTDNLWPHVSEFLEEVMNTL